MKTEEILDKIEELEDWKEIRNFIKSLNLTPKQVELLSDHENYNVRVALAIKPSLTDEKVMLKLANDIYGVRWELAGNTNLTDKVMIKLSDDKNDRIRWRLAENLNLTNEEIMLKLSNDENYFVRYKLASNFNLTSKKIVIQLTSDANDRVRKRAFRKLISSNVLSSEDLESAYDLILKSKNIGRENFEKTFNYIIDRFPELSKLAKMFKKLILKLNKDLK